MTTDGFKTKLKEAAETGFPVGVFIETREQYFEGLLIVLNLVIDQLTV